MMPFIFVSPMPRGRRTGFKPGPSGSPYLKRGMDSQAFRGSKKTLHLVMCARGPSAKLQNHADRRRKLRTRPSCRL